MITFQGSIVAAIILGVLGHSLSRLVVFLFQILNHIHKLKPYLFCSGLVLVSLLQISYHTDL